MNQNYPTASGGIGNGAYGAGNTSSYFATGNNPFYGNNEDQGKH